MIQSRSFRSARDVLGPGDWATPAHFSPRPFPPPLVIALASYYHVAMSTGPNPGPNDLKMQRDLDRRRRDTGVQSRLTGPFFVSTPPVGPGEGRVVVARPPVAPRDPELGGAVANGDGDDDNHVRPHPLPVPPYEAPTVDAFAAVILALLALGIVAVACVFPYQGLRDSDGDMHRWQVTLARWSIARDYPVISSLQGYVEQAGRGAGLEAYLPEADTADEVFFSAPGPATSSFGPATAPEASDADADLEDIDEGEASVGIVAMGPSSWIVSSGAP